MATIVTNGAGTPTMTADAHSRDVPGERLHILGLKDRIIEIGSGVVETPGHHVEVMGTGRLRKIKNSRLTASRVAGMEPRIDDAGLTKIAVDVDVVRVDRAVVEIHVVQYEVEQSKTVLSVLPFLRISYSCLSSGLLVDTLTLCF